MLFFDKGLLAMGNVREIERACDTFASLISAGIFFNNNDEGVNSF